MEDLKQYAKKLGEMDRNTAKSSKELATILYGKSEWILLEKIEEYNLRKEEALELFRIYHWKEENNKLDTVQPIYETAGRTITEKKEIKNMVEAPLVNACEILFDKNIPTFDSSANTENNKKEAWISIIFDELSEENKEIALKNGTFIPWTSFRCIYDRVVMDFPITNDIYILKISNYFENIANSFQKQERLLLSDEEKQKRIQNITQKFMNK